MVKIHHFAHKPGSACEYSSGESEAQRHCKESIFESLKACPRVTELEMEKFLGRVVPDIFFKLDGRSIAIEVQISSLTMNRIIERTKEYLALGIYVLWLSPFKTELRKSRYSPQQWEKWLHATYFGRVYYWLGGLEIQPVHFGDFLLWVEETEYGGGYHRTSRRYRTPELGRRCNLINDFQLTHRQAWSGGDMRVPESKLLCDLQQPWWKH
jgi:competence protein CoiA